MVLSNNSNHSPIMNNNNDNNQHRRTVQRAYSPNISTNSNSSSGSSSNNNRRRIIRILFLMVCILPVIMMYYNIIYLNQRYKSSSLTFGNTNTLEQQLSSSSSVSLLLTDNSSYTYTIEYLKKIDQQHKDNTARIEQKLVDISQQLKSLLDNNKNKSKNDHDQQTQNHDDEEQETQEDDETEEQQEEDVEDEEQQDVEEEEKHKDVLVQSIRHVDTVTEKNVVTNEQQQQQQQQQQQPFGKGKLDCKPHGGPANLYARRMVYWSNIDYNNPKNILTSPYKKKDDDTNNEQFLLFEMDEAGWNNVRMAFENVVSLAIIMGRTLVLPPKQQIWGLGDKQYYTFNDILTIKSSLALRVISMEEFLQQHSLSGKLINKHTNTISYPPNNNQTNWDNIFHTSASDNWGDGVEFINYIRNVTTTLRWKYDECVAVFPNDITYKGIQPFQSLVTDIINSTPKNSTFRTRSNQYIINGPPNMTDYKNRFHEMLAHRSKICTYHKKYQNTKYLLALGEEESGYRMLSHFYAFVYIQDYHYDLYIKRYIRDMIRYNDDIQCAAARIVHTISSSLSRSSTTDNPSDKTFDTFHLRREDFLKYFKSTTVSNDAIYDNTKIGVNDNRTVYVATDAKDKSNFLSLQQHYNLLYMNNYIQKELHNVPIENYGHIDQLVCAQGTVFVGTIYSTFTGYINRIRGYLHHNIVTGGIQSYYIVPDSMIPLRTIMLQYSPIDHPIWSREFPTSWRNIDSDIV